MFSVTYFDIFDDIYGEDFFIEINYTLNTVSNDVIVDLPKDMKFNHENLSDWVGMVSNKIINQEDIGHKEHVLRAEIFIEVASVMKAKLPGAKESWKKNATTYVGIKSVEAVQATALEFALLTGKPKPKPKDAGEHGYMVIYEDGYESWSPRETFQNSYAHTTIMGFSEALYLMKLGFTVGVIDSSLEYHIDNDFIYETDTSIDGHCTTVWTPTQEEMLFSNWTVVL